MSVPTDDSRKIASPRAITRTRRRASRRLFLTSFRSSRSGMFGLTLLAIFALVAILAPLIFPRSALDVTQATAAPFLPPSFEFPLGTDDSGRSVLALVVWGARISLVVGLAATVLSMFIGTAAGHPRGAALPPWARIGDGRRVW